MVSVGGSGVRRTMYSRSGLSLWNLFCFVLGVACIVLSVTAFQSEVVGYVLLYGGVCIVMSNIVDFLVRKDRHRKGFVGFDQGLRFRFIRVYVGIMSVALGFIVAVWLDARESGMVLFYSLAFWFLLLVVGCALIKGETSGGRNK